MNTIKSIHRISSHKKCTRQLFTNVFIHVMAPKLRRVSLIRNGVLSEKWIPLAKGLRVNGLDFSIFKVQHFLPRLHQIWEKCDDSNVVCKLETNSKKRLGWSYHTSNTIRKKYAIQSKSLCKGFLQVKPTNHQDSLYDHTSNWKSVEISLLPKKFEETREICLVLRSYTVAMVIRGQ